jgi:tetratricopeptide (TPR) repeat protein
MTLSTGPAQKVRRILRMEVPHVHRSIISVLFISVISITSAKAGFAQAPAPQHKHYDKPAEYETPRGTNRPLAPRLQNLGVHTFPVSTNVKQAQLFINQGVNLAYAFNHAEAARAFAEAARLDPENPMAYWGHALVLGPNINATMNPEDEPKALALAQKAASLKARATPRERAYIDAVLGAGHIVHMPAHIYQRVGRHADVVKANLLAATADEDYIAQCRAQRLYPLVYYPHNLHFIWMGATASGQARLALESARKVAGSVPHEALSTVPILQGFLVVPYWAMVRFGQWDDILNDKGPHFPTPFTQGAWRYARAMALTAKSRLDEAEQELSKLQSILGDRALTGQITFSANSGLAVLRIAPEVVAGEIAAKKKDWDTATKHLERAVRFEDALIYQEPADWHAPVRQALGAVLLEAGRADEAEAVFWEDLKKNPESGWSLFGLKQALAAQGKKDELAVVEQRLKKAWKDADITLTSARIIN